MEEKIRTVNISDRGQLVVPEDMRKDMGIKGGETLVLIERMGEIVIKRGSDVLDAMNDNAFWRTLSLGMMKNAWGKEDDVWDDVAKGE